MDLGNRIANLRKKNNLSQEELADKIGVTRQTISKWELNNTTPDIVQAKKISEVFSISLDELTDNNMDNILINKVSNTEKLAALTIKILKFIGVSLLIFFILIFILAIIMYKNKFENRDYNVIGKYSITCSLDNETYFYEVEYNKNFQVINAGGDAFIANHVDLDLEDANKVVAHINDYFRIFNGSCETKEK